MGSNAEKIDREEESIKFESSILYKENHKLITNKPQALIPQEIKVQSRFSVQEKDSLINLIETDENEQEKSYHPSSQRHGSEQMSLIKYKLSNLKIQDAVIQSIFDCDDSQRIKLFQDE